MTFPLNLSLEGKNWSKGAKKLSHRGEAFVAHKIKMSDSNNTDKSLFGKGTPQQEKFDDLCVSEPNFLTLTGTQMKDKYEFLKTWRLSI